MEHKILLAQPRFSLVIERLCCQLLEHYTQWEEVCLIGIQPRGVLLSDRIVAWLPQVAGTVLPFRYGKMDITFYRDDFRRSHRDWTPQLTTINFLVENKHVVLIDDVLYTGRSVHAAISALQHFGRPLSVALLTLVDRRFNRDLPIQADFKGITVDTLDEAYVKVNWATTHADQDSIFLLSDAPSA